MSEIFFKTQKANHLKNSHRNQVYLHPSCCSTYFFRINRPSGISQEWDASKSQDAEILFHNSCITQVFESKHVVTLNIKSKCISNSPSLIIFPQTISIYFFILC